MINKNIKLTLLGVLLFGLSIFSLNLSETIVTNENGHDNNITNHLTSAGFWNLTGTPISIYDNDPSKNWSYTASHYDWCSGSGTWIDPYVIENVTINGQGFGSCIEICFSNTYFIIRNCSLYNSGSFNSGILFRYVNNSKIINNNCSDNYSGIEMYDSNNNTLSGNTVSNSIFNGIYLGFGNNNTLFGNLMNFCGIIVWGSLVESASQSIDITNLVNNKPVYYYVDEIGLRSSDFSNAGQIILVNCNNSIISGLNLSNGTIGIDLKYSNNNTISGNTLNNNYYGIGLIHCDNNTLLGNIANNNTYGIVVSFSNNNTISENTAGYNNNFGIATDRSNNNIISKNIANNNSHGVVLVFTNNSISFKNIIRGNNIYGAYIYGGILSTQNLFYENLFLRNNVHAYDDGINNYWNNSIIGNYWDNYTGIDADQDGIGDTPHYFYGGIDFLPIVDDQAPTITIQSPIGDEVFGINAPDFVIEVIELYLDTMWYTIDGDITNITFAENGTISQSAWDVLPEGNVDIKFYANDTLGRIGSQEVTIKKDVTDPIITINNPQNNDLIGATAPNFNITIDELNLDKVWYSLNGGTNITFTEFTGTINQSLWDALPEGNVIIRFYASDSAGNIGFQEITVTKEIPPEILGYDLFFLLGIISVVAIIIIKKRSNHLD